MKGTPLGARTLEGQHTLAEVGGVCGAMGLALHRPFFSGLDSLAGTQGSGGVWEAAGWVMSSWGRCFSRSTSIGGRGA